jgi:phosphoglucomutase
MNQLSANLHPSILNQVQYWTESSVFSAETQREIKSLVESNNVKELTDRFYRDLEFGTGGLRGIMGAGTNRMNLYNIRKATTALALYLQKNFAKNPSIKVAISYDSRNGSVEFSKAAAEVLAAHNITALITKELRPTPMLSFMVRDFGCQAGLCITASHNPPEYNGYKVYWETGAQIISPHDKAIIQIYNDLKYYEELRFVDYTAGMNAGYIREIGPELDNSYFVQVRNLRMRTGPKSNFKIVYTPLHGSGLMPVTKMLNDFGFSNVAVVPEQRDPDGRFPTVKFPNPEDPEALTLALNLAKKEQADMVLATDPDSDRIGMIVREQGEYTFFNGNQLGCLLVDYFLKASKEAGKLPKNPLVIKTIVTTDLQRDIAESYGASCEETLTGFKWICGLIEDYESGALKPYKRYVCGGEESYGFLAGSFVRDKDAVSACAIAAEMVEYYKTKGMTCTDRLHQLFQKHGVYQESLFTMTLPGKDGAEAIKRMMTGLRTNPPLSIDGIATQGLRDYELSQESSVVGSYLQTVGALTLPKSDVLQFILVDGTKVSVRPSGTEPKIKFYISVKDPNGKNEPLENIRTASQGAIAKLKRIEQEFVQLAKKYE